MFKVDEKVYKGTENVNRCKFVMYTLTMVEMDVATWVIQTHGQ